MEPTQSGQPVQEYTDSHFQTFETLRKLLIKFHMKGVPGMDKMIQSLDKIHVDNMTTARDEGQGMEETE